MNSGKIIDMLNKRLVSLRELQSQTGEELDTLSSSPSVASGIPSVLDRAFKGEL
jgi:hypothetical protein